MEETDRDKGNIFGTVGQQFSGTAVVVSMHAFIEQNE